MAPLANDPIMLGRSIWLFGHLECQNPTIISDYIGIPRCLKKLGKSEEQEWMGGMESYSYSRLNI